MMKVDDPITCAEYADNKKLLNTHGWKSLRKYTKNKKKLDCLLKQAISNGFAANQFINLESMCPETSMRLGIWKGRKATLNEQMQKV